MYDIRNLIFQLISNALTVNFVLRKKLFLTNISYEIIFLTFHQN
jgi:hypothetical protein